MAKIATEVTPQVAADALGIDIYTLACQLRKAASDEFQRIAEGVSLGARLPWSVSEAEEELEKPMRLLASAEACMEAYERTGS